MNVHEYPNIPWKLGIGQKIHGHLRTFMDIYGQNFHKLNWKNYYMTYVIPNYYFIIDSLTSLHDCL